MMRTIHKYPLNGDLRQKIIMPANAVILHAGLDPADRICLWADVDTALVDQVRTFTIYGTGWEIEYADGTGGPGQLAPGQELRHISSFRGEAFMWHVYELVTDFLAD